MSANQSYTIKGNVSGTGTFDIKDPILYKRLMHTITGTVAEVEILSPPQNLPSSFFRDLIAEINGAFSQGLYTSTHVCLRKLIENLLIWVLRKQYGTTRVELYYWTDRGRFHNFSVLIDNLEQNVADFRTYTSQFDQHFFDFIKNFKEQADRTTHSVDIIKDPDSLEKMRALLDQYCRLLCDVIGLIPSS